MLLGFVIGLIVGIAVMVFAKVTITSESNSTATHHKFLFNDELYNYLVEQGRHFELTPLETFRKIIKVGAVALDLYATKQGGMFQYDDELGTQLMHPLPLENTDDLPGLKPFDDFAQGLDL